MLIDILKPEYVFFIGLSILIIFFWYFTTDHAKKKRLIGTLLTFVLTIFCLFCFIPPNKHIKQGMDLSGGVRFTLGLNPSKERDLTEDSVELAIKALGKRLNDRGTSDIRISKAGENRIIIDIPNRGSQKIDNNELKKIEKILTEKAVLNFHLEHEEHWQGRDSEYSQEKLKKIFEKKDIGPPNSLVLKMKDRASNKSQGDDNSERFIMVNKVPEVRGKWVNRAGPNFSDRGWSIFLKLGGKGAEDFYNISRNNVENGRRLAIVLDDIVLSALGFSSEIPGGNCEITGDFTEDEVRSLASSLTNPLETSVVILYKEYFPSSLGKAAIKQGLYAGVVGLSLTICFMIFYYRFAGIVALIGLSVNMIILFGLMAIFQFDFTLPGIAGVILTLGIAIDANVLIYERLREEKLAGKSINMAISTAYAKAFSAIFDANITTLISAAVLFSLAMGAVKGFAITLMIGISVSMFSALLVTRICFTWLSSFNLLKDLNFFRLLKGKNINFIGLSKKTYILSILLIILAVSVIFVKRSSSLGIEFSGGEMIKFKSHKGKSISKEDVLKAISGVELTKLPEVNVLTPIGSGDSYISLRIEQGKSDVILDAVRKNLDVEDVASSEISGVVAGEMLRKSVIAMIVALILIMFYLAIRFEFSFSIGAVVALFHDLLIAVGILILCGKEINLVMIGAFLTIAGYSINDTIVVFDRIRETLQVRKGNIGDMINIAINATLSRTILTSMTTLLTVTALFLFGGPSLSDFSLAIIVGVLVGTYSSIFVASPVVYWFSIRSDTDLREVVKKTEDEKIAMLAKSKGKNN